MHAWLYVDICLTNVMIVKCCDTKSKQQHNMKTNNGKDRQQLGGLPTTGQVNRPAILKLSVHDGRLKRPLYSIYLY